MINNFFKIIDQKIFFGLLHSIFQKIRTIQSFKKLKKIEYTYETHYEKKNSKLSELCDFYGSDKGYKNLQSRTFYNNYHPHIYTDFYSSLFDHCRFQIKKVFECGVGSNNPSVPSNMGTKYSPGASLKVWRDYFENANIYGADVDKNILFTETRIKTFFVDQLKKETITEMWKEIKETDFDLIIDDGLHTFNAGKCLFENSFDQLRSGGIYIIEDVTMPDLFKLLTYFKKYNPEFITLKSRYKKLLKDNNLILIRKS